MVLCWSQYFIVALVPLLQHAFPGSWLIKPLCAHIVFERSIDGGGCHNLSETSCDDRGGSLEQVACVLATQRQKKNSPLTINNYL